VIGSEVQVYNMALNAIGARNNVSSPSEQSREAEVCRLWYSSVRDQVLAAASWPEATKFARLAVSTTQEIPWSAGAPRPGYAYTYGLPTDNLHPQYLTTYEQFIIARGDYNTTLLHTNTPNAILAYTYRNEVVSSWSAQLQMAIVYGLAAYICMPLSAKTQRTSAMLNQANKLILEARESSANWNDEVLDVLPEWIQGRGYNQQTFPRFVYPFGGLLAVTV